MIEVGVEYQVDFQRKEELLKSDYSEKGSEKQTKLGKKLLDTLLMSSVSQCININLMSHENFNVFS